MQVGMKLAKLGIFGSGIWITNWLMGVRDIRVEVITVLTFWSAVCFVVAAKLQQYKKLVDNSYEFLYRLYLHTNRNQMISFIVNTIRALVILALLLI